MIMECEVEKAGVVTCRADAIVRLVLSLQTGPASCRTFELRCHGPLLPRFLATIRPLLNLLTLIQLCFVYVVRGRDGAASDLIDQHISWTLKF